MKRSRLPQSFLWACRRWHIRVTRDVLVASASKQQLEWWRVVSCPGLCRAQLWRRYRASTSRFGVGQQLGSNQTPLGLHRIAQKVGAGYPIGTVFQSRRPVGYTWQGHPDAPIAHRIFWLEGLEPGFNQGGQVDSRARYIYVHGLANEPSLGRPASRGCIHLAATDLMPMFDVVPAGTLVWIEEN